MRGAQVSARQALCPGLSRAWKGAGSPFPARLASLRRACEGTDVGTDETLTGVRALVSILRCAAAKPIA